jgi:hypothetical protein
MDKTVKKAKGSDISQPKKISFKFKYNNLSRKRLFIQNSLTLSEVEIQANNLFIVPSGRLQLFLDPEFSQELTSDYILGISNSSGTVAKVRLYVKEVVSLEISQKAENQSLENKVVEELMNQELVRRFVRKQIPKEDLNKIQALRLDKLSDEQVVQLSDKILEILSGKKS